jgi:hypothetical protein
MILRLCGETADRRNSADDRGQTVKHVGCKNARERNERFIAFLLKSKFRVPSFELKNLYSKG